MSGSERSFRSRSGGTRRKSSSPNVILFAQAFQQQSPQSNLHSQPFPHPIGSPERDSQPFPRYSAPLQSRAFQPAHRPNRPVFQSSPAPEPVGRSRQTVKNGHPMHPNFNKFSHPNSQSNPQSNIPQNGPNSGPNGIMSPTVESVVESVLGGNISGSSKSTRSMGMGLGMGVGGFRTLSGSGGGFLGLQLESMMVPQKLWWSSFTDYELFSQTLGGLSEQVVEVLRQRMAGEGCPFCGKYALQESMDCSEAETEVLVLRSKLFGDFFVGHSRCLKNGTDFKNLLTKPCSVAFRRRTNLQASDAFIGLGNGPRRTRGRDRSGSASTNFYEIDVKVCHLVSERVFCHFNAEKVASQIGELNNDVVFLCEEEEEKEPEEKHNGQKAEGQQQPKGLFEFPIARGRLVFSCSSSNSQIGAYQFQGNFDVSELLDLSVPDYYRDFGVDLGSSMDLVLTDSMTGNLLVVNVRVGSHQFIVHSIHFERGVVSCLSNAIRINSNLKSKKSSFSVSYASRDSLASHDSRGSHTSQLSRTSQLSHSSYQAANNPSEMDMGIGIEIDPQQVISDIIERDLNFEGYVLALAQSQHGSRFLQDKLESANEHTMNILVREVIPHISELIVDLFGNYFCQKLVQKADKHARLSLLKSLSPALVQVACDRQGTRVVQKIIEFCREVEEQNVLIQGLSHNALDLMFHPHGSYVVNALLEFCDHQLMPELLQVIVANVSSLALNQHGLCVLKKALNSRSEALLFDLVPTILSQVHSLVNNQYGNYILQHMMGVASLSQKQQLHRELKGQYAKLSCQKFASNVVEKCLSSCPEICAEIVEEFVGEKEIGVILQDSYGNYVMQKALQSAPVELVERLKGTIRPALPSLRKKIQRKWERLLDGAGNGGFVNGGGNTGSNVRRNRNQGGGGGRDRDSSKSPRQYSRR